MQRYDRLSSAGKRIARIPRFNQLMSRLPPERFERLTGEAATYWEVYSYVSNAYSPNGREGQTGLIDSGLHRGGEKLGWRVDSRVPREIAKIRRWQVQLAMYLLGAIAFEMFSGESRDGKTPPRFRIDDVDYFFDQVRSRIDRPDTGYLDSAGKPLDLTRLDEDWECLKQMNSEGLEYVVLTDTTERIFFSDITTQTFFAAYWVARWSNEVDRGIVANWFPDPLGRHEIASVKCEAKDRRDALQERYDEFWNFLVEMPSLQWDTRACLPCGMERWRAIFAPLYDGSFVDEANQPIRSTELIFRTWDFMQETEAMKIFLSHFPKKRAAGVPGAIGLLSDDTFDQDFRLLADASQPQDEFDTGKFIMGAPENEEQAWDSRSGQQDNPMHPIELSPYRLHRTCITNCQYELFDSRHRYKRHFETSTRITDDHPVVEVSWFDAWCFARWLGSVEFQGENYRFALPTEAQWEYACRCGDRTAFTWHDRQHGDRIRSGYCNFNGNYPWPETESTGEKAIYLKRTIAVDGHDAELRVLPNPWGFHQMQGNVWEWCNDWFAVDYYMNSPTKDPVGPHGAHARVLRGGSWFYFGRFCRSGFRFRFRPANRNWLYGFRLAAVPERSR